ncbi:hypothetical protein F5X98DRAFT_52337 [Xylaria grammica]|nr:hypothetical protein F5X98DRAFT_52337 [Xylaria grammica]
MALTLPTTFFFLFALSFLARARIPSEQRPEQVWPEYFQHEVPRYEVSKSPVPFCALQCATLHLCAPRCSESAGGKKKKKACARLTTRLRSLRIPYVL